MDEKFKDVLDSFSDQRIKNILEDNLNLFQLATEKVQ